MNKDENWVSLGVETGLLRVLRAYIQSKGLAPSQIIRRKRPTVFCDFVCSGIPLFFPIHTGETLDNLFLLLGFWCNGEGEDRKAMLQKLRFISIEMKEVADDRRRN